MRLFITGSDGQLGSEICRLSKHENFGSYLDRHDDMNNTEFTQLDITNREKVLNTIRRISPDWIIHCAAATDVDFCEDRKDLARFINVDGTKNIVDASKQIDTRVIYVSTDYIFDGKKGMYKETDAPNPLSYYGKTKLEGERIVRRLDSYTIIRPSVIYSGDKSNFVLWVLDKLKNGSVNIVTDQINSPTLNTELAECILKLIEMNAKGVYHTAGDERISRFDFARKIASVFGFDNLLVKPIRTSQLDQKAIRPTDSSLDTSKIKGLGIRFSNVNNALKRLKKQMENNQ